MKKYLILSGLSGGGLGVFAGVTKLATEGEALRENMIHYTAVPVSIFIAAYVLFLAISSIGKSVLGKDLPKIGDIKSGELKKILADHPIVCAAYVTTGITAIFICGYVLSIIFVANAKYILAKMVVK